MDENTKIHVNLIEHCFLFFFLSFYATSQKGKIYENTTRKWPKVSRFYQAFPNRFIIIYEA